MSTPDLSRSDRHSPTPYRIDLELESSLRGHEGKVAADAGEAIGADRRNQQPCSVIPPSSEASVLPRARVCPREGGAPTPADAPPESVARRLERLPPWQAQYVLALMECGGIEGLACGRGNVSRRSVEKAQKASTAFAAACAEAVEHSTDLAEAACFRGATVGDLQPVCQGGLLVGYKRVRSAKDAELILKVRNRLNAEQGVSNRGGEKVEQVAPEAVPGIVAAVAARLFAARQGRAITIDAATGRPVEATDSNALDSSPTE